MFQDINMPPKAKELLMTASDICRAVEADPEGARLLAHARMVGDDALAELMLTARDLAPVIMRETRKRFDLFSLIALVL